MKLRSHVLILTIGTLLPMIVFAFVGAVWLTERERATFERGATERVRAVLTAVDQELKSSITSLEVLASQSWVGRGDLRSIRAEMARVLASQPHWIDLNLFDASGRRLISARDVDAVTLPPVLERASLEYVLRTSRPAVGDMGLGLSQRQRFTVRVPVVVGGAVK